jgi:TRAP-type C4-dicarboxylate transport system permease small subunit
MDMVVNSLNPRTRMVFNVATSTIAALVCAVITFFGIRVVVELFQTDTRMETYLMWVKWPFMAVIPLSTFFLFIEFLRRIIDSLTPEGE